MLSPEILARKKPTRTRIYLSEEDVAVSYLDPLSVDDTPTTTIYYVPANGGYVRERGSDRQVCTALANSGDTLTATRGTLESVIRREHARRVRQWRAMISG